MKNIILIGILTIMLCVTSCSAQNITAEYHNRSELGQSIILYTESYNTLNDLYNENPAVITDAINNIKQEYIHYKQGTINFHDMKYSLDNTVTDALKIVS